MFRTVPFASHFLFKLFVSAGLGLSASSAFAQATTNNSPPRTDRSLSFATKPSDVGFSADRLRTMDSALQNEIKLRSWPGSVEIVARHGKVVHFNAHGALDGSGRVPMPKDAIFRIMSMTKPVVSVLTMMMVEQGVIKLDDPIQKFLPELKNLRVAVPGNDETATLPLQRPITVYDLLRHTTGFTNPRPLNEAVRPAYANAISKAYRLADVETQEQDLSPDQVISRLGQIPLIHQPGTTFEYGMATNVLGILLERASGERLDLLAQRRIFDPLLMPDSGWFVPQSKKHRLADAFDDDPMKASLWQLVRVEQSPEKRLRHAGAGMVSTASDYFRFASMLANGGELDGVRLLSPTSIQLMIADHVEGLQGSPASVSGPGYGFGLGLAMRKRIGGAVVPGSVDDFNWPGIGGTSFTVDRQQGIVAVFLVQAPSNRIHARHLFKNLVYGSFE